MVSLSIILTSPDLLSPVLQYVVVRQLCSTEFIPILLLFSFKIMYAHSFFWNQLPSFLQLSTRTLLNYFKSNTFKMEFKALNVECQRSISSSNFYASRIRLCVELTELGWHFEEEIIVNEHWTSSRAHLLPFLSIDTCLLSCYFWDSSSILTVLQFIILFF